MASYHIRRTSSSAPRRGHQILHFSLASISRHVSVDHISLMKQQFVVTHTIRQTEILVSLDSSVINTPSVKMLCPQTIVCPYIFVKIWHVSSVGLWRVGKVFFCLLQIVYWWSTTNCHFMNDLSPPFLFSSRDLRTEILFMVFLPLTSYIFATS
jgi:hypothetical protein